MPSLLALPDVRSDIAVPTTDKLTAPRRGLLVLVASANDVTADLTCAADRARVEQLPVLVGLVEPPVPLTIDAAIQARHERRRVEERRALVAAALACCTGVPEVGLVRIRQPRALTAAGARRALQRRAQLEAAQASCVLYPPSF